MSTKQPETLRIADALLHSIAHYGREDAFTLDAYEAEKCLRRLHAEKEAMRAGYDAARLEIASLQAQLEAIGAGGVEPLRKRCLHKISEPAQPVAWAQAGEYPELPERTAFEGWIKKDGGDLRTFGSGQNTHYCNSAVNNAWSGWQASAARGAAQAAPVDATVQQDAARYRFLRDGIWLRTDLESVIRLQLNTLWDSKIDAAIAAKKGGKP